MGVVLDPATVSPGATPPIYRCVADRADPDDAALAAHLAARLADGARPEHTGDLRLAWAAARGDAAAVREVDALIGAADVRRIDGAPAFADEVRQALRVRLLVGDPPRLASYGGRGPLRAWIAVAATRIAVDRKRAAAPAVAADDVLGELIGREPDAELRHLKERYRAELRDALAEALAALPDRPRALLRLHHVEGVRLAAIGRLYGVHESTASRWLREAADAVADDARRRLTARLALAGPDLDSVVRMVRSQLDLSIARLL